MRVSMHDEHGDLAARARAEPGRGQLLGARGREVEHVVGVRHRRARGSYAPRRQVRPRRTCDRRRRNRLFAGISIDPGGIGRRRSQGHALHSHRRRSHHAQAPRPHRRVARGDRRERPDRVDGLGLEPSRGAAHVDRPDGRRHRPLRVHRRRCGGLADGRRQLDPVRGSGRRAELLRLRHRGRRTTSTSTTPATATTTSATGSSSGREIGNPNSFLYALPGVELDRPIRSSTSSRSTRSSARPTTPRASSSTPRRCSTDAPVAPNNVGPKTIPDYDAVAAQAIKGIPGGGKVVLRPGRRPVLRRPRRDVRRDQPPRRHSATRAAAGTTSRATTSTRSCCRSPRRT